MVVEGEALKIKPFVIRTDHQSEPQTLAGAKVYSPTSIQGADQISGLIVDYLVKEEHNL